MGQGLRDVACDGSGSPTGSECCGAAVLRCCGAAVLRDQGTGQGMARAAMDVLRLVAYQAERADGSDG